MHGDYKAEDFDHSPLMFYYEVTQACDLVCEHCRAAAQEHPHPGELTSEQSLALIDQVASFPKRPTLVLTGGDPLKRADLELLIRHAVDKGLQVALTPSATPLATAAAFQRVHRAGVERLGISLDGADAATHDAFRGFPGSFTRTREMLAEARRLGMAVQVNTSITRRNFHQLDDLADLLTDQGIAMWSVFFLIPVGRGIQQERIRPEEYEQAFARLWHHARQQPYGVKTTEAPHYRRYVLQHQGDPLAGPGGRPDSGSHRGHRAPLGVWDGRGVMFVSHIGEIYPAGFLPLVCARLPQASVVETYQNHPVFRALRDADQFRGKCGYCDYRWICGGSRARAFAVTGNAWESEPDCVYLPPTTAR